MDKIPIFKLQFDREFRKKFYSGCEQIFDEGFLTNHTMVREAETLFSQRSGSAYALAVTNGTAALEVALRAIDVRGKEVILPANTFIATFIAIQNAGGIPVIVDVEPEYFSIDPEKVLKKMNSNTKAVIAVHIGGHISPQIKSLQKLCRNRSIFLIEDAAHAHFSTFDGVKAGNFGDVGCFSFHMTKVVTAGEGGMVITNSHDLYEKSSSIRQFGMNPLNPISHVRDGSNFKMNEFTGLALKLDLERSHERIDKRRKIAHQYQSLLKGTKWTCLDDSPLMTSSYYKQIILPPTTVSREKIQKVLQKNNIALTNGVYYQPLHKQPICQDYLAIGETFPISDNFCARHICPPCYPELEISEVNRICDTLLSISEDQS